MRPWAWPCAGRTLVPYDDCSDRGFANWPGVAALVAGVAVSVPLFSNQEEYVGWVPRHWPAFGDITCLVGFAVSAGLYRVLRRAAG